MFRALTFRFREMMRAYDDPDVGSLLEMNPDRSTCINCDSVKLGVRRYFSVTLFLEMYL